MADFCADKYKLLIELEGSQHAGASYDEKRGAWLAGNGYRVMRFWNNDVFENLDGVLEAILEAFTCARTMGAGIVLDFVSGTLTLALSHD